MQTCTAILEICVAVPQEAGNLIYLKIQLYPSWVYAQQTPEAWYIYSTEYSGSILLFKKKWNYEIHS